MPFLEKIFDQEAARRREELQELEETLTREAEYIEQSKAELAKKDSALKTLADDVQKKYNALAEKHSELGEHRRKLQEYSDSLKERDLAIAQREKAVVDRERELQTMDAAFRTIEHNAYIAMNRWDNKEWAYIQELQEEAEKLARYSAIVRRKNGFRFESYIADLLKANGFTDVEVTKKSGDFGGDITAAKNGKNYICQCKYYSHPVGVGAVQEAVGAVGFYKADIGVVVTNNVFHSTAKQLAKATGIELWDCSTIAQMNAGGEFC